jgi:hypothetical protein
MEANQHEVTETNENNAVQTEDKNEDNEATPGQENLSTSTSSILNRKTIQSLKIPSNCIGTQILKTRIFTRAIGIYHGPFKPYQRQQGQTA